MPTPSTTQYFEAIHGPGTPSSPNLFTAAELVAGSFDSAAVSAATSAAVSTVNAAAPDSTSISQARSQAVSAATNASIADSKAVSGSLNTSTVDSKASSNSVNTSVADSKATSAATYATALSTRAGGSYYAVIAGELGVTDPSYAYGDIRRYGGVANGIADDSAPFVLATNASGTTTAPITIAKPVRINSNLTVPATVTLSFEGSGYLSVDSGKTLTILGPVMAPVGQIFAGTGTVAFTGNSHAGDIYPHWWGALGDNLADDTAAFNKAKVAMSAGRFRLRLPTGRYYITDEILFELDRVNIVGDGQQATVIRFSPGTSGKACFHFKKPGSGIMVQCSMRGIGFDATGNLSATKSAIRLTDCEEVILDDFAVSNWTSAGKDCIGLQTRGRQTHSISNYVINCDLPISIEANPNSTISIDHYHFHNGYTIADPSQPHVLIASGVNLTHVTFDGYQAWPLGSDGLKWVDTTSSQVSLALTLKNVRWEQSVNPTGNIIRIEHNTNLNGLLIENCYGGLNTLGIKLRKTLIATIRHAQLINTSGLALDVDSTVQPLVLDNCFFQSGSTTSFGTLKKIYSAPAAVTSGSAPSFAVYALPATITAVQTEYPLMGARVTVAQDATTVIGVAPVTTGYLDIITSEHVCARFALTGATHTVSERDDFGGFFSNTKDTASSYNVYYDAGSDSYVVQNKRVGSKNIQWLLFADNI